MSTQTVIQACAALYGIVPGAAGVAFVNDQIGAAPKPFATEDAMLNHYYEATFTVWAPKSTAEVAALIVANLGITGDAAATETTRIAGELDSVAMSQRGAKVKQIITAFEATEAGADFVSKKNVLVSAVADPTYEGIPGKGVGEIAFSSLSVDQISIGTTDEVSRTALSAGTETATGGSGIDLFTATSSSLTSERTLDSADVIAGGDGADQLTLTMKGDHAFGSSGSMTGVEKLVLNNDTVIGRTFSFTNVTGVEAVSTNATAGGNVSLTNVPAAGMSIAVKGQKSQALEVGYTTAAVSGSADELTLTLADVGSLSTVNLDIDGIEVLNLVSAGAANKVNLEDSDTTAGAEVTVNDFKTISLSGAADTTLVMNRTNARTLDASSATGDLTIADIPDAVTSVIGSQGINTLTTNSAQSALASLVGGTSNDKFTVATDSVRADGTITGGDGSDTLTISGGAAATLQLTMAGVETLEIGAATGVLTFDGTNVSGVENIKFTNALANNVSLTNMAQANITAEINGAATGTPVVTFSNTGELVINTKQSSTATSSETSSVGVTTSKASSFSLNVGAGTTYNGAVTLGTSTKSVSIVVPSGTGTGIGSTITAPGAETFNIQVAGTLAGSLTAAAAKSGTLVYSNASTDAGVFKLDAAALEQLTVTTSRTLDLDNAAGSSVFTALQVGTFTSTKGTLTLPTLPAVASLTLTGSGSDSALDLDGVIGANTLTYPVTLTVSGFANTTAANVTQTIDSLVGVTLDVTKATGTMNFGNINGGAQVVVNANGSSKAIKTGTLEGTVTTVDMFSSGSGSSIGTNVDALTAASFAAPTTSDVDITANTVTYNGPNVTSSNVHIKGENTSTATSLTVTINGGTKTDTFYVEGNEHSKTITVSGNMGIQTGTESDKVWVKGASTASSGHTINVSGITNAEEVTVIAPAVKTTIVGSSTVGSRLVGNTAADTITGGSGVDFIVGKAGGDSMTGGGGNDVFIFATGDTGVLTDGTSDNDTKATFTAGSLDVITDFSDGDRIGISTESLKATSIVLPTLDSGGLTASMSLSDGAHILVRGTAGSAEFTYSASGPDSLYIFGTGGQAVILLGYTGAGNVAGAGTKAIVTTGGVDGGDAYTGLIGVVA
jgi:hypothetical protein